MHDHGGEAALGGVECRAHHRVIIDVLREARRTIESVRMETLELKSSGLLVLAIGELERALIKISLKDTKTLENGLRH